VIRIEIQSEGLTVGGDPGAPERVLNRFLEEAGKLLVEAAKNLLGTDALYALSESYKLQKPRRKGYVHVPGKSADEPLIFTSNLWDGIVALVQADILVLTIDPGHGISDGGFDYGQEWEQRTEFLEKALAAVEDQLQGLLGTIIVEEMLLGL
jgi:hypothetical protein